MNYKTHRLFPVPVFEYRLENYKTLNPELEKYIYNLRENDSKGLKRSNAGGWHSDFFNIEKAPIIQKFINVKIKFIESLITDGLGWKFFPEKTNITNMWAIINPKNTFNIRHNHPNALLSAAYYVKSEKNSGAISFYDPKEAKVMRKPIKEKFNDFSADVTKIEPLEGNLLIFPSYLYHSVDENLSNSDRIVISFNIDIR